MNLVDQLEFAPGKTNQYTARRFSIFTPLTFEFLLCIYRFLISAIRSCSTFLASPNNIDVLGWKNRSFSMPAYPGFMLRLFTITFLASSTSRIGIPYIGEEGSVFAAGLTTSLAPRISTTSVVGDFLFGCFLLSNFL